MPKVYWLRDSPTNLIVKKSCYFYAGFILEALLCGLAIFYHLLLFARNINSILFILIASGMISGSALMTAVPEPKDRTAFMGINSSIQQIAGVIAVYVQA